MKKSIREATNFKCASGVRGHKMRCKYNNKNGGCMMKSNVEPSGGCIWCVPYPDNIPDIKRKKKKY